MKLAVDSFSFHLHLGKHWFKPAEARDLRWYCEQVRALGCDGLHIDPAHFDPAADVDWLRDYAAENGLYVELGGFGTTREELAPWLAAAEGLGSPVLRTFLGGSVRDGREATAARARAARDNLAEAVCLAESHGVIIAVEDHGDVFIEDVLTILEVDSPYLGVCYDCGNFAGVGDDPVAALGAVLDRVACTHLKDMCPASRFPDAKGFGHPPGYSFCALGEGDLPLGEIVEILRTHLGEETHLTAEIHSAFRRGLPEAELLAFESDNVARSVAYARDVLKIR